MSASAQKKSTGSGTIGLQQQQGLQKAGNEMSIRKQGGVVLKSFVSTMAMSHSRARSPLQMTQEARHESN